MLEEHELNYIIDHEVLLITSDTKAKEHVVIDYYPVGDLIGDTSGKTTKEIDDAYDESGGSDHSDDRPTTWTDAGGTGSMTLVPAMQSARLRPDRRNPERTCRALLAKLRAGPDARTRRRLNRVSRQARSRRGFISSPPIMPMPRPIM